MGMFFVFKFVDNINTSYFHTTIPAIARTSIQRALTSAGELGIVSKNNLIGITFGIRPIEIEFKFDSE